MKVKAFTFLEALIVITLLIILSGFLLKFTNLISNDFFTLKTETENIKKAIETARERAVLGDKGTKWGLIFFNTATQDYYFTFAGDSYATATSTEKKNLDKSLNFENIPIDSSLEIIFEKYSGEASSAEIVISSSQIEKSYRINVLKSGAVNYSLQ